MTKHAPACVTVLLLSSFCRPASALVQETASKRSNRLIHESSPYLLLHAHNPVDWYPWGDEAIERARREDKPIFLSVGYSTCYWCHVMEREVFANPDIAALMNEGFVSIKVDREERPDIDDIYMTATQLLRRSGGWPNSVFLTPDLEPFFAGTYFPPEDRGGMTGFPTVLRRIQELWIGRRSEVEETAGRLVQAMRRLIAERREPAEQVPSPASVDLVMEELGRQFDEEHGGFGGAPKFPSPANLLLLWEKAQAGDERARTMVVESLRHMGRGALYDHVGGGFHRYSVDAAWRVPHFEKMLYDNAFLAELLATVAAATGDRDLERWARGTLDFVIRRMSTDAGAFKSAIDAETDGEEGAYYVWTRAELRETLGDEGFAFLAPLFGFDGEPNFPEQEKTHYTLYLAAPLDVGTSRAALVDRVERELEKLRRARTKRPFPRVDDKVLTDWNGMMISAMSRAGELLGEPRYVRAAERAAELVLARLRGPQGTLLHTWRGGEAKIEAFLDDYAFLTRGLLALHDVTSKRKWLAHASQLAEEMEQRLRDPKGGYFLSASRPHLLFQPKTVLDSAIPSANGIAIANLVRLAELTGKSMYRQRARDALRAFATEIEQYPAGCPTLALAVTRYRGSAERETRTTPPHRTSGGSLERLARDVVSASLTLLEPRSSDGWRLVRVNLDIQKGWHVNANPASMPYLIPTQIRGEIRNARYPAGEDLELAFAPQALTVYQGNVEIRGEVGPDESALLLVYQACDDERCLPPVEQKLSVPAR